MEIWFQRYIDTYRSRDRRKNKERLHLRRLEGQLLAQDERMAEEVKRQVALAMSQQQQQQAAPAEPIVNSGDSHIGREARGGVAALRLR